VENNYRDVGQWFKPTNLGKAPADVNMFRIIAAKLQSPLSDGRRNHWPHPSLAIFMRGVYENQTRYQVGVLTGESLRE
jgi:hypothetical protein